MPPPTDDDDDDDIANQQHHRRFLVTGLAETRLSVQKLNQIVVGTFVQHGINAVAISPCFSPGMMVAPA